MAHSSNSHPNIVFILSDQQRWDTVGCYGQPLDVTPNLDRMAAEGVRFEHAFTCQPVCGPARACLQTGRYATETSCFTNAIALLPDEKTIAHWCSEAGYEVGYIGKWHLASTGPELNFREKPVPPERRGGWKDYWLASDVLEFTSHGIGGGHMFNAQGEKVEWEGYRVDCQTDFVLDYLRTRNGSRPFFLFVSYLEPHHQNDRGHFEGPPGSRERFHDFVVPGDLAALGGNWAEEYPDYLGCCASLDYNLGRIRDELTALGLTDTTLLVYTSDHGCHFKTRNGEYKRSCHESSLRIPMIACGPSFRGGQVVRELVSLIDIPPTLLAAGGVEPPDTMHGRPLPRLVARTAATWSPDVFAQISESQVGRCLRTERWKYSVSAPANHTGAGWMYPHSAVYVEDFLYDLQADPHEQTNLIHDSAYYEVRADLRQRLQERMAQAREQAREIRPAQ